MTYGYTLGTNGFDCQNPNQYAEFGTPMVPKLTRTLTDTEGVAHTWVYDTTQGVNETVVTDPSGNDTVYLFYTFSQPGLSTYRTANETQRQIYQGSHTNGTLLKTILTCYNGNTTNCASPEHVRRFDHAERRVHDLSGNESILSVGNEIRHIGHSARKQGIRLQRHPNHRPCAHLRQLWHYVWKASLFRHHHRCLRSHSVTDDQQLQYTRQPYRNESMGKQFDFAIK